jgi:mannose-1-phosphate guanylyltransferase/mannose-6-phosphate isomerase
MSSLIVPLIVCGGSGTRLWPASRASRPKQFLPLFGDLSTFQETIRRVSKKELFGRPVIVTNQDHRFLVADQLLSIGVEADIVLEPEARDSGPAIAAGTAFIEKRDGKNTPVLALAADHKVRDFEGFHAACEAARRGAAAGQIVTFGVTPDHPATGYGYIETGDPVAEGVFAVKRFVEKPDAETATRYVREGYLWNSGNFLFQAGTLLAEYAKREADTVEAVREAVAKAHNDLGFTRLDADAFARSNKRSIDYAVMEKTKAAAVVPATFDWSDVGSWGAVRELSQQDEAGNAALGDGLFVNARRNLISSERQLVCLVGLDDLAVIATGDAILVAQREDAAGVKALVERLKQSPHEKLTQEHLQSYRPWGNYRSLDLGPRHQVKRIVVKPGGRLSLQKHHHRSEHWIVVNGVATVTVNEAVKTLHENESVYIPIGATHRLENPGKIDLHLIEVQTGGYFGEDDIIRIEDVYNRPEREKGRS